MHRRLRINRGLFIFALACLFIFGANLFVSCAPKKSDEEKILDAFNGYLKTQGTGNFEDSYNYLAPQTKKEISRRDWVIKQLEGVNVIKLMRDPRLVNIVVKGNTATADFYYRGMPPGIVAKVMTYIYSRDLFTPPSDIYRETEKYLLEHFDEVAAPQRKVVSFIRTRGKWGIMIDASGKLYGISGQKPPAP